MKTLQPYLIFPGTCREALEFYRDCFQGEIGQLQTFAEAPIDFPAESGERIFNSVFRADEVRFMASDGPPDQELPAGANIALFVSFEDEEEQTRVFERLSDRGKVVMPLSGGFAMVEDRFEIRWMLSRSR